MEEKGRLFTERDAQACKAEDLQGGEEGRREVNTEVRALTQEV